MVRKLPYKTFLQSFTHVPRIAINLLIEDGDGKLLLTKRSIPPQEGVWHFPGSFLRKGETLFACLQRIAHEELGYTLTMMPHLVGVCEDLDKDPRGHVIDIMYRVQMPEQIPLMVTSVTTQARYFEKIPDDMGFNHKVTLKALGYKNM